MIRKTIIQLNQLLAEICGWLLSVMIIFLCIDIVGRGIKQPVQGVAEIAVFVMISAIYLGLAQCEQMDKHVKVTALIQKFPKGLKKGLRIFNGFVQIIVVSILIWAAFNNLIYTYSKQVVIAGTVPLPLWPARVVILVGIFFYWLQSIINLSDSIKAFAYNFHKNI